MGRFYCLLLSLAIGIASASCVGHARLGVGVEVEPPPRLVWIGPGVWVVEDYGQAVFYANNSYWMYSNGIWYSSSYYNDGFVRVSVVPPALIRVRRPYRYVRYRARAGVRTRVIHRRARSTNRVRHRKYRAAPRSSHQRYRAKPPRRGRHYRR